MLITRKRWLNILRFIETLRFEDVSFNGYMIPIIFLKKYFFYSCILNLSKGCISLRKFNCYFLSYIFLHKQSRLYVNKFFLPTTPLHLKSTYTICMSVPTPVTLHWSLFFSFFLRFFAKFYF